MRLIPSLNRVEYLDTQKRPVAHLWDEEFLDRRRGPGSATTSGTLKIGKKELLYGCTKTRLPKAPRRRQPILGWTRGYTRVGEEARGREYAPMFHLFRDQCSYLGARHRFQSAVFHKLGTTLTAL